MNTDLYDPEFAAQIDVLERAKDRHIALAFTIVGWAEGAFELGTPLPPAFGQVLADYEAAAAARAAAVDALTPRKPQGEKP